jgi:hypothetical protein
MAGPLSADIPPFVFYVSEQLAAAGLLRRVPAGDSGVPAARD